MAKLKWPILSSMACLTIVVHSAHTTHVTEVCTMDQ